MDNLFSFFQSLTAGTSAQRLLFVVGAAATVFLLALGVSFLAVAATDPVRRRLNRMAGESKPRGAFAQRILTLIEPVSTYVAAQEVRRTRQACRSISISPASGRPTRCRSSTALKTGLALAGLFGVAALSQHAARSCSSLHLLLLAMFAAFVGSCCPTTCSTIWWSAGRSGCAMASPMRSTCWWSASRPASASRRRSSAWRPNCNSAIRSWRPSSRR